MFHHLHYFTDDHISHRLELFLLRERYTLRFRFRVKTKHLVAHILPERICLCYALVARKLIDDCSNYALSCWWEIAVYFFASVVLQPLGKLSYEQFEFRIADLTVLHFLNQRLHDLKGILFELVSVCSLLNIDVLQVILENLPRERRPQLKYCWLSEIAFVRIGREDNQMHMYAALLFMECSVPFQV